MPAPRCRVLAGSKPLRFGSVQDAFDPPAHSVGRFRLRFPDGLQTSEHIRRFDASNRHLEQLRRITHKRRAPLCLVFVVAEHGDFVAEIVFHHLLEHDGRGSTAFGIAGSNRISTGCDDRSAIRGKFSSIGKSNARCGAKSHFPPSPCRLPDETPRASASRRDGQVKAAAIGMQAGVGNGGHSARGQLVQFQGDAPDGGNVGENRGQNRPWLGSALPMTLTENGD